MRRLIGFLLVIGGVTALSASVNCSGIPSYVKVGEYGAQENYLIVTIGGRDYRLGYFDDVKAKYRFSLAQTALVSNKDLILKFYSHDTCDDASSNRTVPNATLLK